MHNHLKAGMVSLGLVFSSQVFSADSTDIQTTRGTKTISCSLLGDADPNKLSTYTGLASAFHNADQDVFLNKAARKDMIRKAVEKAGMFNPKYGTLARMQFKKKFDAYDHAADKVGHIKALLKHGHQIQNLESAIAYCRD